MSIDETKPSEEETIDGTLSTAINNHIGEEPILKYFRYNHLPPALRAVSRLHATLAIEMMKLPRSAERAAGLRKLLEAKDCFVRASLP